MCVFCVCLPLYVFVCVSLCDRLCVFVCVKRQGLQRLYIKCIIHVLPDFLSTDQVRYADSRARGWLSDVSTDRKTYRHEGRYRDRETERDTDREADRNKDI